MTDDQQEQIWQRDRVLNDWTRSLEYAQDVLLTSKTKTRTIFLQEEILSLAKHADLTLSQILDIFKLLTLTYPRYSDSASRDAVEAVGMELVRRDELRGTDQGAKDEVRLGVAEQILGWLSNEVGKLAKRGNSDSYAASDLFVLLTWSCGLYTICVKHNTHFIGSPPWKPLVGSMAILLDMILESSKAKPSLKNGALVRTRRALRSAGNKVPTFVETILSITKTSQTPTRFIPLLGVSISVLIRLKNVTEEPLQRLPVELKDPIIASYNTHILMTRTVLPEHVLTALNDFVSTYVTADDLTGTIQPTIEKALLRSPEYSLPVAMQFFSSFQRPLPVESFQKLLAQIINSAKSSNAVIRTNSVGLFKAIVSRGDPSDPYNLSRIAAPELINLPKTGKSAGPDHRVALYSMLALLTPAQGVSSTIVDAAAILLPKEPHESATICLANALSPHIVFLLYDGTLKLETVQFIAKEMTSNKPAVKKAFVALAGSVFLSEKNILDTKNGMAFANGLLPSLENNLKTVTASPLNSPGGPYEGYVAVSVLLGSLSKSSQFEATIAQNPDILALTNLGPKQSFLFWDKVYQRVTEEDEERWLLRACDSSLQYFVTAFSKSEHLRTQLGLVYVYLSSNSSYANIRKLVNASLVEATTRTPQIIDRVVREALTNFVVRGVTQKAPATPEEQVQPWNKHARLSALLLSAVSYPEDVGSTLRENAVVELIVLSHHTLISGSDRPLWVDIVQKAGLDPREVVDKHLDKLTKLILDATTDNSKSGLADAAYRAVTTLAFISPVLVLSRIVDQLKEDLNPDVLNAMSDEDLSIWATPEGTTYVDVLSSTKGEVKPDKGKDYEIAKWEAEVRKTLAAKKATPVTLTRQQQVLVQAQLEKEAKIRKHVQANQAHLVRGLHFVRSLVSSRVEELQAFMSTLVSLLLKGALARGSFLAGSTAFDTYLDLSKCTSDRLDTFGRWIGIASLRCLKIGSVPEGLQAEPLHTLVIRVLYRLRFLSEKAPFDAATFSYAYPLISQIMSGGGIQGEEEDDDPLEQVALVLEIIKFHCGEFSNPAFPRLQTLENLVHVIRQQPNLGKEASSNLIDLGEAISTSATSDEIAALLRGTLSQESYVRNSCLQAMQPFDLTEMDWSPELWIASHDDDEQNARLAQHVWEDNGLDIPDTFLDTLVEYLGHDNAYVRSSVSAAIAEAVEQWPQTIQKTVLTLEEYYREKAKVLAPEFDQYGMVIASSLDRSDPWAARVAIAQTFRLLAPSFTEDEVEPFFKFLIEDQALGDRADDVRRGMLSAGTAVIDFHGKSSLSGLIKMFEDHLQQSTSSSSENDDYIKEAVVILFGRVARHLEVSDPRISEIVNRLVDALKTPSEQVQIAVSECLSPLVTLMRPRLPSLVDNLFDDLFNGQKYASRRGAAYGIAGVIRGTGIGGMKEFDVIRRLKTAAEEKKRYEPRQGIMFVFETLSATLGRLFEPYIIYVLPLLLASFGDATADVREATQDAARVIMSNLSGYGVKLILPTLLEGLDEKQWRSKKGSIELLGMMAYCSPRQLSISLPIVIPRLTGVLTDSHAQVRTSANKSLKQFGEVISNPEIQSLVPILLKALVDPAKTASALAALLKKTFMHYIDHSSLALVVPILERGLKERGADTKKKAAQIVGNLASLTDSKDFVPYLDELLPMVHQVLVDPVPEARATAAKALGTLVERLGEIHFPDLVPGLLRTLKTDTSGVDRQGAAQGLSEVLSGLGMERLEGLLPDILANARSPRATVREGFMSLLVYLPATFGSRFQPHLPKIIPPILLGLSDTEEYVREAAMRAGRMVINNYSNKAIDLLLPELENGMFDPGWRIRQSSITLVGELLFKVSGISGKAMEVEEEEGAENVVAESSRRVLVEVLGVERRDRILAALYLVRQDGVVVVRQASIQIWKVLVNNTPKTVREILPELINQTIFLISSDEFEQQETAGRTVAELCRKFGERIVGEIMAILKGKATSSDPRTREGVALVISQIMRNCTEAQREDHEDDIISIVRAALVDDEANVRTAAAQAFDDLQEQLGVKAIDQTIPTLLEALRQPGKSSGTALQALKEVMNVRASTVFPVLIPTLTAIPMTLFNARALATLVTVAGNALSKRLTAILSALVKVSEDDIDDELREAVDEATEALFSSVSDAEGLNTVMMLLMGWAKNDSPARRVSACKLFVIFCNSSELDDSLYRIDWIRQLISLFDDSQVLVHTAAWAAFDTFVKSIPKDELEPLVVPLRRTIESTGAPGRTVPGFDLPKGIASTVPIIIAGLTTGSNEQREQAAYAIGDLVERTEENAMKPFVVPFTGPLIRVATQAMTYPPGVKIAILSALTSMLERIPAFVKPFFPQLQRTFAKSVSDSASSAVRTKAAEALGVLMKNQPRVDPVITELITGARGNDDSIATSFILALSYVVRNAAANVGDKARETCIELISDAFRESHSEHYCQAVGSLVTSMSDKPDLLKPVIQTYLVPGTPPSIISSHVILAVLNPDEDFEPADGQNLFQKLGLMRKVAQKALENAASDKSFISRPAREARDLIKELDDDSLAGLF